MSYGIVLKEKPLDEGLTLKEVQELYQKLHGVSAIPYEVQGEFASAMGFINLTDAEIISYDYGDSSYLYNFIASILNNKNKENATGEYTIEIANCEISILLTR